MAAPAYVAALGLVVVLAETAGPETGEELVAVMAPDDAWGPGGWLTLLGRSLFGEDDIIEDAIMEDAAIEYGLVEGTAIEDEFVGGIAVAAGPGALPPPPAVLLAQTVQGIVKVAVSGVSPQTVHTVEVVVKPGGTTVGLGGVGVPEPVEVML